MRIMVFTIVFALSMRLIRSQLLSFPNNTIANIGQRVELECSTNATFAPRWDFAEVNSSRFKSIYALRVIRNDFSSRYQVNTSIKGRWALLIDSVDFDHAGTYKCENSPSYETPKRGSNASAELIVRGSDPVCDTNASTGGIVEGDYIEMWCTFNLSGNLIPVLKCTRNSRQKVDTNIHISYKLREGRSFLVTNLVSSDNGVTITCKLSISSNTTKSRPPGVIEIQATNTPPYQHLWNYTANVLYGPRNLTIILIDGKLQVGSRMRCFADGNPTPSYKWEIVGKNISLSNDSVLVADESMISDVEQTLRCTATNYVADQTRSNETTLTFNLTETPLNWMTSHIEAGDISVSNIHTVNIVPTLLVFIIAILILFGIIIVLGLKLKKLSAAFDEVKGSTVESQKSSKRLRSSSQTYEDVESHRTEEADNYCSLKDQSAACQQQEVYCELRPVEKKLHQEGNETIWKIEMNVN